MKCGNIREELMEAVLSGPELATPAVQEHLATCSACAQEVASLRQSDVAAGRVAGAGAVAVFLGEVAGARARGTRGPQSPGWLAWLRRPAVMTAAAALLAVGVGMLEGAHWKADHAAEAGRQETPGCGNCQRRQRFAIPRQQR